MAMPHVIYDDLTLEQFLRLPEAKPALEYIDGIVVQKVSPKLTHSSLQALFILKVNEHARSSRLGKAYPELRCTHSGRSLVHDLCFIARARIPRDARGRVVDDVLFAPDLAIEIISPGQTVKNMTSRLEWCVQHGVRLGWLIQPRKELVLVFRPDRATVTLKRGEELIGEDVLPGFRLPIDELFDWLLED